MIRENNICNVDNYCIFINRLGVLLYEIISNYYLRELISKPLNLFHSSAK